MTRCPGFCPDCGAMCSLPPADVRVEPVHGERGYVESWVCSSCQAEFLERYAWVAPADDEGEPGDDA